MAIFRSTASSGHLLNSAEQIFFHDLSSPSEHGGEELLKGLSAASKYISPKFFYDECGSELFTEITQQPEYYLTKTETKLLRDHVDEISRLIGKGCVLIEYGSGSSTKIKILLDSLRPSIYAPLDISKEYLISASEMLATEYHWLTVNATCVDFTAEFDLPFRNEQRKVGFFPGSSIGNFEPAQAMTFLGRIRNQVGDGGSLLLGVDLQKDVDLLNAAYNDVAGVTRLFNLNVLQHINDSFGGNFVLENFEHEASYNVAQGCVQMFLISQIDQEIELAGQSIAIGAGERIHTENSYKYTVGQVQDMAEAAGFRDTLIWTDSQELFGLFYLTT